LNTITIQIPDYLRRQVESLTSAEGYTVDQFFATAASEKLAVIREHNYIAERAQRADEQAFEAALKAIPDNPEVEEWDRKP
jgi:hypothetical protein